MTNEPRIHAAQAGVHKPPVTEAHMRAAFDAMHWTGWTFEQALADDVRHKLVEVRATLIRNREWRAALGIAPATAPKGRTQHNFHLPGTPRIF